jgi:hypothetical protein
MHLLISLITSFLEGFWLNCATPTGLKRCPVDSSICPAVRFGNPATFFSFISFGSKASLLTRLIYQK